MTQKTMTPATVGVDDRGQESVTVKKNNTIAWCTRQLVSAMLPWIAAAVSTLCSPSGKAARTLDRLNVLAEGGWDES
jgi:hypothetical protein